MRIESEGAGRRKTPRPIAALALALVTASAVSATGCGRTEATLEVVAGSEIRIQPPPDSPLPAFTTQLAGTIEGAITLDLNVAEVLRTSRAEAVLTTDAIRIAGSAFALSPETSSGTLCVSLDPANPPAPGQIVVDLDAGTISIDAAFDAVIQSADPALADRLPPVPLSIPIRANMPFALADVLGGGAGDLGALSLTQALDLVIGSEVPLLGGARLTGSIGLQTLSIEGAAAGPSFGGGLGGRLPGSGGIGSGLGGRLPGGGLGGLLPGLPGRGGGNDPGARPGPPAQPGTADSPLLQDCAAVFAAAR